MTTAATFASNVVNFCEQLEEFWAYSHLLKGMSQRLSHCCVRELLPLMELPAVKQVSIFKFELYTVRGNSYFCRAEQSNYITRDIKHYKVLQKPMQMILSKKLNLCPGE